MQSWERENERDFVWFFLCFWPKNDCALLVCLCSLSVCVEFYFIWLFMTSACVQVVLNTETERERGKESEKNETRFMGLLKFMTIAFPWPHRLCVNVFERWKNKRKNLDEKLFVLGLDRWYNDKTPKMLFFPFKMVYIMFGNVQTIL